MFSPDTNGILITGSETGAAAVALRSNMQELGNRARKSNYEAVTDPTTGDNETVGYRRGSRWLNTTTPALFECIFSDATTATWIQVSSGSGGPIAPNDLPLVTVDDRGAMSPEDFFKLSELPDKTTLDTTIGAIQDIVQGHTEALGTITGGDVGSQLASLSTAKAPLASPAFTGTPTTPTAAPGTNNNQVASTAFAAAAAAAAAAAIVDSSPATLDTLNELAAALGDDANFATTVTNALATKAEAADLDAVDAAKLTKAGNLSDLPNLSQAHTNFKLPFAVANALRPLAGDGTTDDRANLALAGTDAVYKMLNAPASTYRIGSAWTMTGKWELVKGATIKPDSGVQVTVDAEIVAGDYPIFDTSAGGTVLFSGTNPNKEIKAIWFGVDPTGSVDDLAKMNAVVRSKPTGTVADLGLGTFSIGTTGIVPTNAATIKGVGMGLTVLKARSGTQFLIQTSGSAPHAELVLRDLTLDCNDIAQGIFFDQNSSRKITIERVEFINMPSTSWMTRLLGCRNVKIRDCVFEGMGKFTGQGIVLDNCRDVEITGNRFRYLYNAIMISTGTGLSTRITEDIKIENNLIDGGWWTGKERFFGASGVTYSSTVLSDAAAAFGTLGLYDTVRVMPVLQTGTYAVTTHWNLIQITGATFVSSGVKPGHVVRSADGKFAIVQSVESETRLWVEEWLSDIDRRPSAPPGGVTLTIYGIYIGRVSSNTATTITVARWYDLDGASVTPSAATRYEVLYTHGNYPIHGESGSRRVIVSRNKVVRGWSDQISNFGRDWRIIDNYIADGQDMGITLENTNGVGGSTVIGNHVYHQGASNLALHSHRNKIIGNTFEHAMWENADAQLGNIWHWGGDDNIISDNQFVKGTAANLAKGIGAIDANARNHYTNNKFYDHSTAGIYLSGSTNTNAYCRNNTMDSGSAPAVLVVSAVGTDLGLLSGTAAPEGSVTASPGTVYWQVDTSNQQSRFWRKTSGGGTNSGWVEIVRPYEYPGLTNLIPNSETFALFNDVTVTSGQADPWGTTRASLIEATSGPAPFLYSDLVTGLGPEGFAQMTALAGTLSTITFRLFDWFHTFSTIREETYTLDANEWRTFKFSFSNLDPAKSYRLYVILGTPPSAYATSGNFKIANWQISKKDTPYLRTTGSAVTTPNALGNRWDRAVELAGGFGDGTNVPLGVTTGTKIGTATGQKLGFWGATPVAQQVLATGAGATVDNVITLLQTLGLAKQS